MEEPKDNEIDKNLALWRQGDLVFTSEYPFIHLADLREPLTSQAIELAGDTEGGDLAVISTETIGFVVLSQTCDIVRPSNSRPFVEIAPILRLDGNDAALGKAGRLSRFVFLPAIKEPHYFVDLDRVMTFEKSILSALTEKRQRGLASEQDERIFAEALGRRRSRAAFPDEFVHAIRDFQRFIINNHDKNNANGVYFRSVREIRIVPKPEWDAETIEVDFLFVFDSENAIPINSQDIIDELLKKVVTTSWLSLVEGRGVSLTNLSAAMYLDSDRLELDHLSNHSA